MIIDIKKFAHISSIHVEKNQEEDIIKGILDILLYIDILNKSSELTYPSYDQRKLNVFRSSGAILDKEQDEKKVIILKNAPILNENYFNVPSLIIRKS